MSDALAPSFAGLFRPAVEGLVPYEPGKPVEEVQRELGLERVVKLASNEGPFGPFPAAADAIQRGIGDLNRYPDGGAWRLRTALAAHHGVRFEEVAVGAGADGVLDCLTQAALDPGDEVVCGWPSFPSYVIDAVKLGAVPVKVPLREQTYDLEAMLDAITPRTKLVMVCHPNNPTGTINGRDDLAAFLDRVPPHVLTVIDQAYFEYVTVPDYVDAIEEHVKSGRKVLVLRTFSKIYGLAGMRVGYGIGPAEVVTAINKTKRAFDVTTSAQDAALASLDDAAELERRRGLNATARTELEGILRDAGLQAVPGAVANFLFVEVEGDARLTFDALLRLGVIVRPLHGFGAPAAIRVTAGTADEHRFLASALQRLS